MPKLSVVGGDWFVEVKEGKTWKPIGNKDDHDHLTNIFGFPSAQKAFEAVQGWYGSIPSVDFKIKNQRTHQTFNSKDYPDIYEGYPPNFE